VKTCSNFCSRDYFKSDLLHPLLPGTQSPSESARRHVCALQTRHMDLEIQLDRYSEMDVCT